MSYKDFNKKKKKMIVYFIRTYWILFNNYLSPNVMKYIPRCVAVRHLLNRYNQVSGLSRDFSGVEGANRDFLRGIGQIT